MQNLPELHTFITTHTPFTKASDVAYFLSEVRKQLELNGNGNQYPLLQFYCDWSLHASKDRNKKVPEIKVIMEEIYTEVEKEIKNPALVDGRSKIRSFLSMDNLQKEMESFMMANGLPLSLVASENWIKLARILVSILVEQPIVKPCATIKQFSFQPANENCFGCRIDFQNLVGQYEHYELYGYYGSHS